MAVGVIRPRAVAPPTGAWGRNCLTALERPADVAVGGSGALGSVHRLDTQVSDREAELVQPSEHRLERCGDVAVHDELARMSSAVEAPVPDGEQPELRERDGAVRSPEAAFERDARGAGKGRTAAAAACGWSARSRSGRARIRNTAPGQRYASAGCSSSADVIDVSGSARRPVLRQSRDHHLAWPGSGGD